MEFLIDRSGYLRFRWIPAWVPGWDQMAALFKQVHLLNTEPLRPPAPMGGTRMEQNGAPLRSEGADTCKLRQNAGGRSAPEGPLYWRIRKEEC